MTFAAKTLQADQVLALCITDCKFRVRRIMRQGSRVMAIVGNQPSSVDRRF